MVDYRSVEILDVYREGEFVAQLRRRPKGCEFNYTTEFLASNRQKIALHLPTQKEGIQVEGIANLPTYFAGLLPEGVMYRAAQRLIGAAADDLFAILAATGVDAIGDIAVRIPGEAERKPALNLAAAAAELASLLRSDGKATIGSLAAIPGVQPKMSIGELVRSNRGDSYIAKFPSPEFPDIVDNELAIMGLAKLCRIHPATVTKRSNALIVKRFDRVLDRSSGVTRRLHVEDMVQVLDQFPHSKYSMEFVDLLNAMEALRVSKATLLEGIKLYAFSYLVGNGDLHAKNVSLTYDQEFRQWRLSQAYDLLTTLPYAAILPGADRMALALADETFGNFTRQDFLKVGTQFGLPEKAVTLMLDRLSRTILKRLPTHIQPNFSDSVATTMRARAESLA